LQVVEVLMTGDTTRAVLDAVDLIRDGQMRGRPNIRRGMRRLVGISAAKTKCRLR
jgi:hypothetical protein